MKKYTYEELMNFYIKTYSANLMNLVILGKQPLDTLENWARSKFVFVKNKHIKKASKTYDPSPFKPENLGVIAKYQSLSEKKSLNVIFPLPEVMTKFEEKPLGFLTYLLGMFEYLIGNILKKRDENINIFNLEKLRN